MIALYAVQHAVLSLVMQLLFFPLWWYSGGAKKIMLFSVMEIQGIFKSLSIPTLFAFLFAPMFGFRDPVSRAISITVRCVHFALMLALATVSSIFWIAVLFLWLILPVLTVYQYWFHFFS